MELSDEERIELAWKEYNKYSVGDKITINGKLVGYVITDRRLPKHPSKA